MSSSVSLGPRLTLQGVVSPPGDKSISHRLILLSSIAEGTSRIDGFLRSEDCLSTLGAMRDLGVSIEEKGKNALEIKGVGLRGLKAPRKELDMGNSGTTTRVLLGLLAAQPFEAVLTGDDSLKSRPMRRVTDPLKLMGAAITGRDGGNYAPLRIKGGPLKAIRYENVLGSAQVKSALLMAGLYAEGTTEIVEPRPSRDHTERLLKAMGVDISIVANRVLLKSAKKLRAIQASVPGDLSSAAFWLAAGAIQPGRTMTINRVGLNPTRMGFVKILKKMGVQIEAKIEEDAIEPVGSITIKGGTLKAVSVGREDIPSLIDELPLLMVLGAFAKGRTVIRGAEELRVKETDRIHAMVKNLDILGVSIEEHPDGVEIQGGERLLGGTVESFNDHRIAMAMAIASLRADDPIEIRDTECVSISYPEFFQEFDRLKV